MSSDAMKEFLPEQQRTERIVAAIKSVSDETGRSMAQVALTVATNVTTIMVAERIAAKLSA